MGFAWLGSQGNPLRNDGAVPGTLSVNPPALLQSEPLGHAPDPGLELLADTGSPRGAMILRADAGGVYAWTASGELVWTSELGGVHTLAGAIPRTAQTPGMAVVLLDDQGFQVALLDMRDGRVLWTGDIMPQPAAEPQRAWFVLADIDRGAVDQGAGIWDVVLRWHGDTGDRVYGILPGQNISRGEAPVTWDTLIEDAEMQDVTLLPENTDNDQHLEILVFLQTGAVSILDGLTGTEDRRWTANNWFAQSGGIMNRSVYRPVGELPNMAVLRSSSLGVFNLVDGSPLWLLDYSSSGSAPVLTEGLHIADLDGDGALELVATVYNDTDTEIDADGIADDHDGVNAPQRWATLVFDAATGDVKASLLDYAVIDMVVTGDSTYMMVTDGPATESVLPPYYKVHPLSWKNATWQSGTELDTGVVFVNFARQPGFMPLRDCIDAWWPAGDFAEYRIAMLEPEEGEQARWAALRTSADDIRIVWEYTAAGGLLQPVALYDAGDTLALSVTRSDGVSGFLNIADDSLLMPRRLAGSESMYMAGIMETSCAGNGPVVLLADDPGFVHEISLSSMETRYSTRAGEYRIVQDSDCAAVAVLMDNGVVSVPSLDMTLNLGASMIADIITLDAAAGLQGVLLHTDTDDILAAGYTLSDGQQQFLSSPLSFDPEEIGDPETHSLLASDLTGDMVMDMIVTGETRVAAINGSDGQVVFDVERASAYVVLQTMLADVDRDDIDDVVMLLDDGGTGRYLEAYSGVDGQSVLDLMLAPEVDRMAAADLDRDGADDVVVANMGAGVVTAISGIDGSILWVRSLGNGEVYEDTVSGSALRSLMTVDTDGLGFRKVLAADTDGFVYGVSRLGSLDFSFAVSGPFDEMIPWVTDNGTQLLFHSRQRGAIERIGTGEWQVPQNVREVAIDGSDNQQDIDVQENSGTVLCACDRLAGVTAYTMQLHAAQGAVLASQDILIAGDEPAAVIGPAVFDGLSLSIGQYYYCSARMSDAPAMDAYSGFSDGIVIVDRTGPSIEMFAPPTPVVSGAEVVSVLLRVTDRTGLDMVRYYGPGNFDGFILADGADVDETLLWMPVTTGGTRLPDGVYRLWVEAADRAGNYSEGFTDIVIDSLNPQAPEITDPANDTIVTRNRPIIGGTAGSDAVMVVVAMQDSDVCTAIPENGAWECTSAALEDGEYTISAKAIDAAGNESTASEEITFLVRTAGIVAPVIQYPADGSVTSNQTPEIGGRGEFEATLEVLVDGVVSCSASVAANGTWFCTPQTALDDGQHTAQARQQHPYSSQVLYSEAVLFTVQVPVDGDEDSDEADIVEEAEPEQEIAEEAPECVEQTCPECEDNGGGGCSGNGGQPWALGLMALLGVAMAARRRTSFTR